MSKSVWAIVEQTPTFTLRTVRLIESDTAPVVRLKRGQRLMRRVVAKAGDFDPRLQFPSAYGLSVAGDPENV